jgi:tetratricopeptide (TPR) repeat protein
VITPEERKRIEQVPTSSLTAYDYQQRGLAEHQKFVNDRDPEARDLAEILFFKALELDSSFAECYVSLAIIHRSKAQDFYSLPNEYYDSCFRLLDLALSFDPELSDAYTRRGIYLYYAGQPEAALRAFEEALEYNPNSVTTYMQKGLVHLYHDYNMLEVIKCVYEAMSLRSDPRFAVTFNPFGAALTWAGFKDQAEQFFEKSLELHGDSSSYFYARGGAEYYHGYYQKAVHLFHKAYVLDSADLRTLSKLGETYLFLEQYDKSLDYYHQYLARTDVPESEHIAHIAYVLSQNGQKELGEYYLDLLVEESMHLIAEGTGRKVADGSVYHRLFEYYAVKDEKEKAIENLKIAIEKQKFPFWKWIHLRDDPIFYNLREEMEFKELIIELENKYQDEHEEVRKWLEQNDML